MALLELIGAGAGLLQGLNQNRQAAAQQRRALDLYAGNVRLAQQDQARRTELVRRAIAGGLGNADESLGQEDLDFTRALKKNQRAIADSFASQGFQPGDSPWNDAQASGSDDLIAQHTALRASLRRQAAQDRLALDPYESNQGVAAAQYGYANAMAGAPQNQQRDLSGLVGAIGGVKNDDLNRELKRIYGIIS